MNQLLLDAYVFLANTKEFVFQGVNPGGHYAAIWCRDASYIFNDWFVSGGSITEILKQISFIWSHQIESGKEKLIYGRGSPDMNFQISTADRKIESEFKGALPTTIYSRYNFSEVYSKSPDIDSTALMVSPTSFILHSLLNSGKLELYTKYQTNSNSDKKLEIADHLVPKISNAIDYLNRRDMDDDYLLEQNYNEDWMDTTLRTGKIVYSQASWILSLKNFSALLFEMGNEKSKAKKTLDTVNKKLWSQTKSCYVDLLRAESSTNYEPGIITQDILLFLLAIAKDKRLAKKSENHEYIFGNYNDKPETSTETNLQNKSSIYLRGIEALDTVRKKIWKGGWPLVTESQLTKIGPAIFKTNEYHNYTCWPWMAAIEMLARSRFGRLEKQDLLLLSELISKDSKYAFYEWIDPITETGYGAFPFRTGISCMRLALREIVMGIKMYTHIV